MSDRLARDLRTIWRRAPIEERDQPVLRVGKCAPADLRGLVRLVEVGPREERRRLLVVADDEAVLGRARDPLYEGRHLGIDRLRDAIEHERAHLIVEGRADDVRLRPRRLRGARQCRVVERRGGERIPRRGVDRRRERRARYAHHPVVLAARRQCETCGERAVASFAEPQWGNVLQDTASRHQASAGRITNDPPPRRGRTTRKWRSSSVRRRVVPARAAITTTAASARPRPTSRYRSMMSVATPMSSPARLPN